MRPRHWDVSLVGLEVAKPEFLQNGLTVVDDSVEIQIEVVCWQ